MGKMIIKDKTKDDCLMRLLAAKHNLKIADVGNEDVLNGWTLRAFLP